MILLQWLQIKIVLQDMNYGIILNGPAFTKGVIVSVKKIVLTSVLLTVVENNAGFRKMVTKGECTTLQTNSNCETGKTCGIMRRF